MNINQLSANIDIKLEQLEKQLLALQKSLQANSDNKQIAQDIAALEQLKIKLKKSRDIAWSAHELQRSSDDKALKRNRIIGLSLCIVCGLGLCVLIAWVLLNR